MAWFDQEDAHIFYEDSGNGESVLLLPGWGGTIDELVPLREALTPRFRVIAADLPGSGKSGPQPRTYTPGYHERDARALLAMLDAIGASPAHLVGFSDGGEYALLMAAVRPDAVRSVVAWGAAGSLGNNRELAGAMSTIIDDPIPPMHEYSEYMKAAYGEANARIMAQSLASTLLAIMDAGGDLSRSRAAEISAPALLIAGENDPMASPALVSDMAQAMQNADFVEAMGAGHAIHHEQSEWLTETVVGWLSKR